MVYARTLTNVLKKMAAVLICAIITQVTKNLAYFYIKIKNFDLGNFFDRNLIMTIFGLNK